MKDDIENSKKHVYKESVRKIEKKTMDNLQQINLEKKLNLDFGMH